LRSSLLEETQTDRQTDKVGNAISMTFEQRLEETGLMEELCALRVLEIPWRPLWLKQSE